jgi:hypothetical protein
VLLRHAGGRSVLAQQPAPSQEKEPDKPETCCSQKGIAAIKGHVFQREAITVVTLAGTVQNLYREHQRLLAESNRASTLGSAPVMRCREAVRAHQRHAAAAEDELSETQRALDDIPGDVAGSWADMAGRRAARYVGGAAALAQAKAEVPVVELHPAALNRYIEALADLAPALCTGDSPADEAMRVLRELISEVVVTPGEASTDVVVHGYMARLLGHDQFACRQMNAAEVGLEPPAPRLLLM